MLGLFRFGNKPGLLVAATLLSEFGLTFRLHFFRTPSGLLLATLALFLLLAAAGF